MAKATFIESGLFARHGVRGIFSLRNGGISPAPFDSLNLGLGLGDSDANVAANLNAFVQSSALPGAPHQAMQVHQNHVLWCSGKGRIHDTEADILLTNQSNTPLAVRTADCLPILLADPKTSITAAVHAGWRGTAVSVVKQAIQSMCERGAKAEHILATLGPCIEPCCFSIGKEVATALKNSAKEAADFIQGSADLRQINRLQLLECGLIDSHIECLKACTACDSKRFFSFRRDTANTGRQLAVVAIACKP